MHPPPFIDLAALNGEPADLVPVLISRDAIERKSCASLLGRLRSLSADRETTLRMRGRLLLCADGYDEDPRPLAVIPEFQSFAVYLTDQWPEWAWYVLLVDDPPEGMVLEPKEKWRSECDGSALPWLLGDTCPPEAPGNVVALQLLGQRELRRYEARRSSALGAVSALAQRHDLPRQVVMGRCDALMGLRPYREVRPNV